MNLTANFKLDFMEVYVHHAALFGTQMTYKYSSTKIQRTT